MSNIKGKTISTPFQFFYRVKEKGPFLKTFYGANIILIPKSDKVVREKKIIDPFASLINIDVKILKTTLTY